MPNSPAMRVALASCSNLPHWEVDDMPFHRALAERGVEILHPSWDDPAFNWGACDACLIRTTWDYMERRDEFVAWAEATERVTRLFNPAAIARWNTHKSYLAELEARGVAVVPTVWLAAGSEVDLEEVLAERGWRRGFLKPAIGATARETLPFTADAAGLAAARRHLGRVLPREDMLLQPYLSRVEREGERSAIFLDGKLSHAVVKIPLAGDYRVQDDYGARDEPTVLADDERTLAEAAIAAAGAQDLLYARVDWLRDDDGAPKVNELELVEPSLFFRHAPEAAGRLAEALVRRILPSEP